jgi:hypothetical protein
LLSLELSWWLPESAGLLSAGWAWDVCPDRTAELLVLLSAHDVAHHQHRVERDPVADQSIDRAAGGLGRRRSTQIRGEEIARKPDRFGVDVVSTFWLP